MPRQTGGGLGRMVLRQGWEEEEGRMQDDDGASVVFMRVRMKKCEVCETNLCFGVISQQLVHIKPDMAVVKVKPLEAFYFFFASAVKGQG